MKYVFILLLLIGKLGLTAQIDIYQYDSDIIDEPFFSNTSRAIKNSESVIRLNLSQDTLLRLPREISELMNIRELFLSNNSIKRVPAWVSSLRNLSIVSIGGNSELKLGISLKRLAKLKNLRVLWIGGHSSSFPKGSFKKFDHLKTLIISKQPRWNFEDLIEEIKSVETLENLELSFNEISSTPSNIGDLSHLKVLSLEYNNLTASQKKEIEENLPDVKIIWEPN